MFRAKNYLNRPMFHGVIQKIILAVFFSETRCFFLRHGVCLFVLLELFLSPLHVCLCVWLCVWLFVCLCVCLFVLLELWLSPLHVCLCVTVESSSCSSPSSQPSSPTTLLRSPSSSHDASFWYFVPYDKYVPPVSSFFSYVSLLFVIVV